jgi:hypothetical protein
MYAIKIHRHRTLAKALYIKCKHTNTSINTQIHNEITIKEIPIKINTVITTHMITHKNKHINNNATCKFITQLALILVRMSPTTRKPSMNLPTLDHTVHHSQQ